MVQSPVLLRYPGAKNKMAASAAIGRLVGRVWGEFREPFAGSLGVTLDLLRHRQVDRVWINDLDEDIAALWTTVIREPEALIRLIKGFLPTRDVFDEFRASLLRQDDIAPAERALRKLAVHRMGKNGYGTKGGPMPSVGSRWNADSLVVAVRQAHELLTGRVRENRCTSYDFTRLIEERGENVFLYLDPPYVKAGRVLYEKSFKSEDHARLAGALRTTGHRWLLSYDDHPQVRSMYPEAECEVRPATVVAGTNQKQTELLILPRPTETTRREA